MYHMMTILEAMRKRDQINSTREVAPLQAAVDAIVIDSGWKKYRRCASRNQGFDLKLKEHGC